MELPFESCNLSRERKIKISPNVQVNLNNLIDADNRDYNGRSNQEFEKF